MIRAAASALCLALAACATGVSQQPTRALYQELVIARIFGLYCHEEAGARFDERITALRPWLDREIGAGEGEAMLALQRQELAVTDFARCPTREGAARTVRGIERRLSILERRAGRL
jgi:hypothetical protein